MIGFCQAMKSFIELAQNSEATLTPKNMSCINCNEETPDDGPLAQMAEVKGHKKDKIYGK